MPCRSNQKQKGLTLVEVLVGIVIGMLVILATGSILILGNKQHRATVASSDLGSDVTFIHNILDQAVRSAGTGFLHGNNWSPLGCNLNAKNKNNLLIPTPATAPNFLGEILTQDKLPLSPILIANGLGQNNILVSMNGSQTIGGTPQEIIDSNFSGNELILNTSLGLQAGDLVIINSTIPENGIPDESPDCYLSKIASIKSNTVVLSPDYLPDSEEGMEPPLSALVNQAAFISSLGQTDNAALGINVVGINAKNELQQINLLNQSHPDTLALNVIALRAIYGIDNGLGQIAWIPATGAWSLSNILAQTRGDRSQRLRSISAIRVSLLIKSTHQQNEDATNSQITHFADYPSAQQKTTIADADKKHQHHLLEFTIPLRNALFAHNLVNF